MIKPSIPSGINVYRNISSRLIHGNANYREVLAPKIDRRLKL